MDTDWIADSPHVERRIFKKGELPPTPCTVIHSLFILRRSMEMSFEGFSDLECQTRKFPDLSGASPDFIRLTDSIAKKIATIAHYVNLIHKYVGSLGTSRDTIKIHTSLNDTLSRAKSLARETIGEIRLLALWDEIGPDEKFEQTRLANEFQNVLTDLQNAQRLALEKSQDYLEERKEALAEERGQCERSPDGRGQRVRPLNPLGQGFSPWTSTPIEFNEQLIEEREREIEGFEQGIVELGEVFRELGTVVTKKGSFFCKFFSPSLS